MTSPFYLHNQPHISRITDDFVYWIHLSFRYTVFSILEALKRLNATSLNSASSAFLINLVNLVLFVPLYKLLNLMFIHLCDMHWISNTNTYESLVWTKV